MPKEKHRIVPAVYLLPISEGKIFLIRRCNTGFEDGNYAFIAGHMEKGETVWEAMVREAREEANIIVKSEDLQMVHVMHRKSKDSERVDFFLTARKWEGEPINNEPDKCDHVGWFPMDNLPENTIDFTRQVIECYRKGEIFSEHGWDKK